MIEHVVVEVFSDLWWKGLLITLPLMGLFLGLAWRFNERERKILSTGLGAFFLAGAVLIHPYLIYLGKWTWQTSVPLHMCTLSAIISGWMMIRPNQWGYEMLMYWGIPGGIHSLLTPEFIHGTEGLLIPEYYFLHGNIVFVPLYLSFIQGMQLRRGSWWKAFLYTQWSIPVVGGINWLLGSNYMYLAEKPLADNPFILGDWPWYILILEAAVLLHFVLVYFLFGQRIPALSLNKPGQGNV